VEPGHEAGEAVDVLESLEFSHPRIVTGFLSQWKADFAENIQGKCVSAIESYPHDYAKSRKKDQSGDSRRTPNPPAANSATSKLTLRVGIEAMVPPYEPVQQAVASERALRKSIAFRSACRQNSACGLTIGLLSLS
jgi:hypothetical protein